MTLDELEQLRQQLNRSRVILPLPVLVLIVVLLTLMGIATARGYISWAAITTLGVLWVTMDLVLPTPGGMS